MEAELEFKQPFFFPTKTELTKQWRAFSRYPVNASENGDLNGGRKSFLMEFFFFIY